MLTVGLTYDLKTDYVFKEGDPPDANAEFDHPDTVGVIRDTIASLGYRTKRIGNINNLLEKNANEIESPSFLEDISNNIHMDSNIYFLNIYLEYLIIKGEYIRAVDLLNSPSIEEVIKQNIILLAHQYYLFGKIAQQDQNILEPRPQP